MSLQGLRGAAALMVVIDHSMATLVEKADQNLDLSIAFFIGKVGVCIFFTISGFVMVMSHHQDFQRGRVLNFILKRIGRVAPLYYITTGIYALKLTLQGTPPGLQSLLLSALFIPHQAAGTEYGQPVYGLGWTLQYEMFFYVAFALSLLTTLQKGITLTALIFVSLSIANQTGLLENAERISYLSQPIVLYFVIGLSLGFLKLRGFIFLNGRPLSPLATFTFAIALVFCAVAIFLATKSDVYLPVCFVGACAVCMLTSEKTSKGLTTSAIMLIGNATYSIYLTHSFIVGPAGRLAAKFPAMASAVVFCTLTLLACSALGLLVHKFVEKPLLRGWKAVTAPFLRQIYGHRMEISA